METEKKELERKWFYVYICDDWWKGWIPVPINIIKKEGRNRV